MKTSWAPFQFQRQMIEKAMANGEWIEMAVELGLDPTEIYEPFLQDMDSSDLARLSDVVHKE